MEVFMRVCVEMTIVAPRELQTRLSDTLSASLPRNSHHEKSPMLRCLLLLLVLLTQTAVAAVPDSCEPDQQALNTQQVFSLSALKKKMNLPEQLGWVRSNNLCGGYFSEPEIISAYPNPLPISQSESTITATGPSVFRQEGPSTLQDNVTFAQKGRQATADKAVIHREASTGKINCIDLYGHVHFREAGKLLVGNYTHIDLKNKTWQVSDGVYNVDRPSNMGMQYGWGMVGQAVREPNGTLELSDATYTTCAPTSTPWHVKAKHITLNKETGRGVATNAWLYAGGMPVFYTPYANFPIDKRRYSGWLYPSFAYNSDSGFITEIPYYFNLAPNYDATLTLTPMTNRGLQFTGLFRYLTETSEGFINASILPDDREFARFKNSTFENYPPNSYNNPFLIDLDDDSATRSAIGLENNTVWNENWSASLDINLVSDDYYFQDFGSGPATLNTDQLLNQLDVNYQNEHWEFLARLQAYQTLHIIDDTFVADQYQRLPQLVLDGSYPNQTFGLDYDVNAELVNFQHVDDYFTGEPYPTGTRFHLSPQISKTFSNDSGYVTPSLVLDLTSYSVINNASVNTLVSPPTITPTGDPNLNDTRVLPIVSLDNGLYFERLTNLGGNAYTQTLEPRAYYLFVPRQNQNDIPVFDTTLPTFDIDQIFRNNRFIGYDRVGDANQLSLGVTTRFLDNNTGANKLDLSLGGIYYFRPHTVCLYPDCSDDPTIGQSISPVAAEMNYRPNTNWVLTGSAAWDPNQSEWENAGARLLYTPLPQHVFKVAYNFVQDGDNTPGAPTDSSENNLQRLDVGSAWQVRQNWNLFADWNYNLSHRRTQGYLYGVEYNSCCWAIRLVANQSFLAEDVNGSVEYRNNYYIQFLLKGLGSVGSDEVGDLLVNTLPGYKDYFK